MFLTLLIDSIIFAAFQFRFMALVVDIIDRGGPGNKMYHQLQPIKSKVHEAVLLQFTPYLSM